MNFWVNNKHWSDEKIIAGLLGSERDEHQAILALHEKYGRALSKYADSNIYNKQYPKTPDDFVWETIEAFVVNIKKGSYTKQNAALETYLISICKNLIYRYTSQESSREKRTEVFLEDNNDQTPSLEDWLIENEDWEYYIEVISKAGKNCRRIMDMRLIEALSMKEIADILIAEGLFENEQTVRNAKSKCLKKIFELLTKTNTPTNE